MSHDEASFAVAEQMGNSFAVTGSPTLDLTITEGGWCFVHRHCEAMVVQKPWPSHHSFRMATDNITVGTTEVKHSIYYILGCRDTSSSGWLPLTAHHMPCFTHHAHGQRGHRACATPRCASYMYIQIHRLGKFTVNHRSNWHYLYCLVYRQIHILCLFFVQFYN